MIVEKFMSWSREATPTQRADGASALARAYLYAALDETARRDAERGLTRLLDDHSPLVRRAIAEAFASAIDAPQHIVLALADDQSDVSAIVLARSPVLNDAALIDCAAVGDAFAQSAIAVRPGLSASVAAALAEVGGREALVSLAVNTSADLPDCAALRMLERFGADGELREALLARPDLSAGIRCRLMEATASALAQFAVACRWLSDERAQRLVRDGCERAHVIIAARADEDESVGCIVAHLRASSQLTSALLLRSLLCGRTTLFAAALSDLTAVSPGRVAGLLQDWRSSAFAALYRRAGLPLALLPGFRAVLDALQAGPMPAAGTDLSRALIDRVLARCEAANAAGALDKLLVVLRRLHLEAVRDEARREPILTSDLAPMAVAHVDAPVLVSVGEEPLLLSDPDLDPRLSDRPQAAQRALRAMPRFTIDFTALEAELMAA